MRTRQTTALAAIAAATLLLTACGQSETRDEFGEITTGGDTDVFSIAIGDCFNDEAEAADQVNSLPTVPCSEPHDNEIFAEYTFPDGDYPGDDAVATTAMEECVAQFEDFVGISYDESALTVFPITPTEGSWDNQGDRLVSCGVWDSQTQVTGSLEGAAY